MTAEMWGSSSEGFTLYVAAEHKREIRNIKRSRDWDVTATYLKNDRIVGIQWRIPLSNYRAARRIEQRINGHGTVK